MAPQAIFFTFLGSNELENASLNIVDEINLQFRDFLR